ncbi:MAG: lytic transglycosylase domain-containing protein [Azospirillaceae bacterium]
MLAGTAGTAPARAEEPVVAVAAAGPEATPDARPAPAAYLRPIDAAAAPWLIEDADIRRYRRVFALQEDGRWAEADRLIAGIRDRRLMGHVLFQRYMHPTDWRSSYAELSGWLERYADHPGADRIHRLAMRRKPAGTAGPRAPVDGPGPIYGTVERYGVAACDAGTGGRAQDRADQAAARYFDRAYDRAWAIAEPVAAASADVAPDAAWIAGLVAWRRADYAAAAELFGAAATARCASPWHRAAGAYWAARSELRSGNPRAVSRRLAAAAAFPRTFYGLIARRALGLGPGLQFEAPVLDRATLAALTETPAGERAIGLLQVGLHGLAEAELYRIRPDGADDPVAAGLVALAQQANMPGLAVRLGMALRPAPGGYYDGALYPLGPWAPDSGFAVDRALVHAVIRQESLFDPEAVSYAGARGLMQLMPATAAYVAESDYRSGPAALERPEINLELGQRYIRRMLSHPEVGPDLVRLIVGYNAGPGNVSRWFDAIEHGGDPLLFIESIPNGQARHYVERVLASFWIYRARLAQPTPSLDAVAAGAWPPYITLDRRDTQVASNPGSDGGDDGGYRREP